MATRHYREELEKHIAAVERDLEAMALQAKEAEDALERLKASEMEAAGRLSIAARAIADLQEARAAIEHARNAAAAVGAELPKTSPGEPPAFAEEWSRLEQLVRDEANLQLESDLVEAAANSSMGYAIKDLPAHLQQLARQRRRTLLGQ